MKKGNFILFVLIGFTIFSINTSCNFINAKADAYPTLLKRSDTTSISTEFKTLVDLYTKYTNNLKQDSNDDLSRIKLVELYISEARISGNLSYYHEASLKSLNTLIAKKTVTKDVLYKALTYKATILLSLHQFTDAKIIATQALAMNPYDADIYGALVDANVELGNYQQAVVLCDKMMTIRPDIRSYSRISYLRQIMGDNVGAISAMRMAVESGAQGLENTEWARVQLGDLYLNTGHADTAKMLYESSIYVRPNYPYAEMGLAKVASAQNQIDTAIIHCKNAIRAMSESSFVSYLGELYKKKGDTKKANEIHHDVLKLVLEGEKENETKTFAKHNGHRELANAYLYTQQFDEALKHAKQDYQLRPQNIDANELMAWVYFLRNENASAKSHIEKALSTNSQNATLIYKASLIYEALGEKELSQEMKSKALTIYSSLPTENFIAVK